MNQYTTQAGKKKVKGGYCQFSGIAPVSWFKRLATPYGDPVIIDGYHEFLEGLDFIHGYSLPRYTEVEMNTPGENGSKYMYWQVKLFIPGNSPSLQAMLDELKNEPLIMLIKDLSCTDTYRLQFGDQCAPAFVSSMLILEGRKGYELTISSVNRFIYDDGTNILYWEEGYSDEDYVQ